MIGPHEGKELELMLAGEKPLAMFHDAIPKSGEIIEEIIPEKSFASHVEAGTFIRISEDIPNLKRGGTVRYVFFAQPGEEWRAKTYLWLSREILSGKRAADDSDDIIEGRLLGYSEEDIVHFLEHRRALNN